MEAKITPSSHAKGIIQIVAGTALLLLVPLVAMRFTDEVHWTIGDFVTAATLLIGTGLLYEFAVKKVRNIEHRTILEILLAAALILVWIELAVGLFD
ncbi:MAG TPA: hypothetical protein VD735_06585 [Candidatus Saccharimonadales bacterium]|nr:hypothetical protein [Candidatus Saccharimonadales bacterium]